MSKNLSFLFDNGTVSQSNGISAATAQIDQWKVAQNVYYIAIGLFIILANTAVWATILAFRRLRSHSELLIVAALMLSETTCGIAYFSSGIWRLSAALDPSRPWVTAFDCMKTVHGSFFVLAPQFLTLMTLVISIDRLICIVRISHYGQMTLRYIALILGIPGTLLGASYAYAWISSASLSTTSLIDPACMINSTVSKAYYLFYNVVQVVAAGGSVLIYCVVICIFSAKRSHAVHPAASSIQVKQLKRQRKITKTLALMSLLCFVTYLVPQTGITLLGTVYTGPQAQKDTIVVWMRIVMAFYSACNAVIYLTRPSEVTEHIRFAFQKYICLRKGLMHPVPGGASVAPTAVTAMKRGSKPSVFAPAHGSPAGIAEVDS